MAVRGYQTEDLERRLLNLLITNQDVLSEYIGRVKEVWFTTPERKFIFGCIRSESRQQPLTRSIFEFETHRKVSEDKVPNYIGEFVLIDGLQVRELVTTLIAKLTESERAAELIDVSEQIVGNVIQGNVTQAISVMKKRGLIFREEEDKPIVALSEVTDEMKERFLDMRKRPWKYRGIPTSMDFFDRKVGGMFAKELTLVYAHTGVGKSTMMRALAYSAKRAGYNTLIVINEEYDNQVRMKYYSMITGISYQKFKMGELSDLDLDRWEERMKTEDPNLNPDLGELYIKEIPQYTDATRIADAYYELIDRGKEVDLILFDYMDLAAPTSDAWGEFDEEARVSTDLKALAVQLDIPVLTCTQAATQAEKKQNLGTLDVYGSKKKSTTVNTMMGIHLLRVQKPGDSVEGEEEADVNDDEGKYYKEYFTDPDFGEVECQYMFWKVNVPKNRDGETFSFYLKVDATHQNVVGYIDRLPKVDEVEGDPKLAANWKPMFIDYRWKKTKNTKLVSLDEYPPDGILRVPTTRIPVVDVETMDKFSKTVDNYMIRNPVLTKEEKSEFYKEN